MKIFFKGSEGNSSLAGGQTIQYPEMPTASTDLAGKIVQYVGTTNTNYTNGYFYKCVLQAGVYKWEPKTVQAGGSGGEGTAVDYTEGGVYYYLPTQLKNVIIEKKFLLPTRYSASGLLSDDNSWAWKNIGKLWLPDECEVYGMPVWGGKGGYSLGGSALQYPLFAGNMNRLKFRNGGRDHWWLLSPSSGDSTSWCNVRLSGHCSSYGASASAFAAPVCFRVG